MAAFHQLRTWAQALFSPGTTVREDNPGATSFGASRQVLNTHITHVPRCFNFPKPLSPLKQVVFRGIARRNEGKLSRVEAHRRRHLTSAPWLALDPKVWPCQLTDEKPIDIRAPNGSAVTSKSSDLLPCSSPASQATPSVFSEDNASTAAVLTMLPPSIPNVIISDYDGEMAGRRFDLECEHRDMFLKKAAKVGQLSGSDANALVREDPKTLGFLAPPGAFPVVKRKKRVIPRNTCPLHGAHIIARKRRLPSAPWLALDPMVWWPCQLTDKRPVVSRAPGGSALPSKSPDLLPCSSSPTSPATPCIFSGDNYSTVMLLTVPPRSIPFVVVQSEHRQTGVTPTIADHASGKAGRRSKRSPGRK
ncbi:hypothetical protein JB92DRAFT_3148349 [Gautieria morchelliformis]|nr:hypothetical protein JB92DRAFT_3148349 [Gautieria morchelliformis]